MPFTDILEERRDRGDPPIWRNALEASTCWDFPHQSPEGLRLGDNRFNGCTPAMVIWNLLVRYTRPGDLVVDCMAGGGTTIDVAEALGRRVIGFDISPSRKDIVKNDARRLLLADDSVDFHFLDLPYSDNLRYSDDRRCIGRLSAREEEFYQEIGKVADEVLRTLRPGGHSAWVISDEYRRHRFTPVGFRLYDMLRGRFETVDIVALVRHHDSGGNPMWMHKAREKNFFLRGFNYLFIMRKRATGREARG